MMGSRNRASVSVSYGRWMKGLEAYGVVVVVRQGARCGFCFESNKDTWSRSARWFKPCFGYGVLAVGEAIVVY